LLKKITHTLFSKGSTAFINFAILLITSKVLGGEIRGEITLFVLNIAIIQIVNEIYTGYTLVHFIPKFSFKKLYKFGFLWVAVCTLVLSIFFYLFNVRMGGNWVHLFLLSFIVILHSFHLVFILGKEKIKLYNWLSFYQPLILLLSLLIFIFVLQQKSVTSYIISMYISFVPPAIISSIYIFKEYRNPIKQEVFLVKQIFTNGFYNQFAALTHMLSNRYNYYLLSTNLLVGVYSSATSLIESVWLISGSVTPIILTHVANSKQNEENKHITFVLAKLCFLLSIVCVLVLYFIPDAFFVFLLGDDFAETKHIMLLLSPGILCVSFSSIIVHYYSGIGQQKTIALANLCGFITTISLGYTLISNYSVIGACYVSSISYFITSMILLIVFMRKHHFTIKDLFEIRKNIYLIKNNNI
jgi:O-antigen/teichoic acid export membrane protein